MEVPRLQWRGGGFEVWRAEKFDWARRCGPILRRQGSESWEIKHPGWKLTHSSSHGADHVGAAIDLLGGGDKAQRSEEKDWEVGIKP